MEPYDVRDLLTLVSIPRLGPIRIRALLEHFHDPARALAASPRDLVRVRGIDRPTALLIARASPDFAESQIRSSRALGAEIIACWDDRYPLLLASIYDPPVALYVLGDLGPGDRCSLAIVGTRHPSSYGHRVTEELSRAAVGRSIVVVSGLARGIDTTAHTTALDSGGRTIAVLGSGLDIAYPPENARLMHRIAGQGAVLSEFPLGTKPDPTNFPRRNRIVSGLTLGTVIVESAIDGGAMITASAALDQGREVFAVPGPMYAERSAGPHALIRDGRAKLVTGLDDIVTELRLVPAGPMAQTPAILPSLTLFERAIYDQVGLEPIQIDDLADRSSLAPADALVALLGLEFKGLVRQMPGKWFVRM